MTIAAVVAATKNKREGEIKVTKWRKHPIDGGGRRKYKKSVAKIGRKKSGSGEVSVRQIDLSAVETKK